MPIWIVTFLLLFFQAIAAQAGPLEDCEQAADVDHRIRGCSERIRQFPLDVTAFFNRALAHLSKGDLNRAIADTTWVIDHDPAYAGAYYYRGIAYARRSQHEQAIADFSKAVELNSRYGAAFNARARVYLKTGQPTLALDDAERAVSLEPDDDQNLETRALTYELLSLNQKAVADYRRMLSKDPSSIAASDGLRRLGIRSRLKPQVAASRGPARPGAPARPKTRNANAAVHTAAKAEPSTRIEWKIEFIAVAPRFPREEVECERAQQQDASGRFARYPCWAREAFSRRR